MNKEKADIDLLLQLNAEGTSLRRHQQKMLEMLRFIDDLCRKNGIPYFLSGGTLLGAVRHKGFIPWDDDLDIALLKKDHKKLHRLAIAAGLADQDTPDEEAAGRFIEAIKLMKERFGIGNRIPEIREEDIPKLAHYADKEANPLYPVPVLLNAAELEAFYYMLMNDDDPDTDKGAPDDENDDRKGADTHDGTGN